MPKIIINELDKTEAQGSAYKNFSVVIPGAVAEGKGVGIFDENDVYECSSKTAFVDNIGLTQGAFEGFEEGSYATGLMRFWWNSGNNGVPGYSIATFVEKYSEQMFLLEPNGNRGASGQSSYKTKSYPILSEDLTTVNLNAHGFVLAKDDSGSYVAPTAFVEDAENAVTKYAYFTARYGTGSNAILNKKIETNAPTIKCKLIPYNNCGELTHIIIEEGENEGKVQLDYSGFDTTLTATDESLEKAFAALTTKAEGETEAVKIVKEIIQQRWSLNDDKDALNNYNKEGGLLVISEAVLRDYFKQGIEQEGETSTWGTSYKILTDFEGAYNSDIKFSLGKNGTKVDLNHYGNQIAYELLGLGYTVLYKKLPERLVDLQDDSYWEVLEDKVMYDFRYLLTGFLTGDGAVRDCITTVANHRGDCLALLDIDENCYAGAKTFRQVITDMKNDATVTSQYAAYFAPTVTYKMSLSEDEKTAFNENKTFPASFHFLACASKAHINYNEWYAIAGYTRGVSDLQIDAVGYNFGSRAINALAPRNTVATAETFGTSGVAINLIANERGNYYIWGNRTAYALTKEDLRASHFLNVRELCTSIKKLAFVACRKLTFDPNSETLWINFKSKIAPLLNLMKADQGILDYKFEKVNPGAQKGILKAKIRIIPIEAVEDFEITLVLEDDLNGGTAVETEG